MSDVAPDLAGKLVVFLNPPVLVEDIMQNLSRHEFEVVTCKDPKKVESWLAANPATLVFVNLDTGKVDDWRVWVSQSVKRYPESGFGVFSLNEDKELAQFFLMEAGIQCGYIVLKIGAAKATEILTKTLEANEARGRRRYVRAATEPGAGSFNMNGKSGKIEGSVLDVSSVGMAVGGLEAGAYKVGTRIHDIQLNLKGSRLGVDAIVLGFREDPARGHMYVLMFDPATLNDDKREKIAGFIRRCVQANFDRVGG